MSIKVKLFVDAWITEYAEPSVFVTTYEKGPQPDYMRLGVMEVEFPFDIPTEEKCIVHRKKMEELAQIQRRETLLKEIAAIDAALNILPQQRTAD